MDTLYYSWKAPVGLGYKNWSYLLIIPNTSLCGEPDNTVPAVKEIDKCKEPNASSQVATEKKFSSRV